MSKPKSSKKKAAATHRVHLYFSGRVQGVGFRYTAQEIALSLGILGWVKNLHDGRVEIVGEGTREALEEFAERVRAGHLGPHVKKCDCSWEEPTGEFSDFSVEFSF